MLIKGKSNIHGIGIFSDTVCKKGSVLYKVPLLLLSPISKMRCAKIAEGKYVDDPDVLNWVNHSCEPNMILSIGDEVFLEAISDISPGEELTCDYNLTEKGGVNVSCTCNTKSCRGYFLRVE